VGVSRKEVAGRSKASERAGHQARHPEKALDYPFRMSATVGWRARGTLSSMSVRRE
jgi:hypothetical protein